MSEGLQISALLLNITGRVQGVGFRESMREVALTLNIVGWVRNRDDGSVEALVQGESDAIEHMIVWAHRGPPGANVLAVTANQRAVDANLITFVRQATY